MKKETQENKLKCYICGKIQPPIFEIGWHILGDKLLCQECYSESLNFIVDLYKNKKNPNATISIKDSKSNGTRT